MFTREGWRFPMKLLSDSDPQRETVLIVHQKREKKRVSSRSTALSAGGGTSKTNSGRSGATSANVRVRNRRALQRKRPSISTLIGRTKFPPASNRVRAHNTCASSSSSPPPPPRACRGHCTRRTASLFSIGSRRSMIH